MASTASFSNTGRVEISVGVPSILMQIVNGKLLQRLLTITPLCEFYEAKGIDKLKIIAKTAVVGLITLGVAAAVTILSSLTIYAIPLCLIVTMGLSFNFLNEEAAEARNKTKDIAMQSLTIDQSTQI
jgi:hypothetical protein